MVYVKIKINKNENFGIDIPDEMDLVQFNGVVERFQNIQRTFGKGYSRGLFGEQPKLQLPKIVTDSPVPVNKNVEFPYANPNKNPNKNPNPIINQHINSGTFALSDFEIVEPDFPDSPRQDARSEGESEQLVDGLFSRAMMIRLLRDYWSDTLDESERRIKETIRDYELPEIKSREDVRLMIFKAIIKYKILPEEVDLVAFPTPGNNDIKYLRKKKE